MIIKCMCCDKYLGDSKFWIEHAVCDDCSKILKDKHGENISFADVLEVRKSKEVQNVN